MKESVIAFLSLIYPMSDQLKEYIYTHLKETHLKKKEIVLREGEVSNNIAFIIKGLLRSYHITDEGIDTTVWFMKEGDVAISVRSFLERKPSKEFIEAIEPSIILHITYNELQEAYQKFPEFNIIGRILTERYYVLSEERLLGIRNIKAVERYKFLLTHHPEIIERAPTQHIASYLDIDKATLSRLKRNL